MKVELKRNWYTPRRRLYLKGVHEIPDSMKDILPSTAVILEEEPEVDEGEAEAEAGKKAAASKKAAK